MVKHWAEKNPKEKTTNVLRHFPLNRACTTSTFACNMEGEILPAVVHWKGGPGLMVANEEAVDCVLQFCQKDTHWCTIVSLLFFIENVIMAHFREHATPGDRFILCLDAAVRG
eukprot:GILJ01033293.1.p1 GENE.GILJ01033293.1~~GILJ01033293.1.p1  ORF type:complete len:113 (-),score=5.10 GILJ01033293.1:12-350(-)